METENRYTIKLSEDAPEVTLEVSQPKPVLPKGLSALPHFISSSDSCRLVDFFDSNPHLWSHIGFEKLRREQRYDLQKSGMFAELDWIIDRIHHQMNSDNNSSSSSYEPPNELIVEERYPAAFVKEERCGRLSSATFESHPFLETTCCPCTSDGDDRNQSKQTCSCYVAQMTLINDCIQFVDKPKQRLVECWKVKSQRHKFNFIMEPNTLVVKKGEALWAWRSRIAATSNFSQNSMNQTQDSNENEGENETCASNCEEDDVAKRRIITIKFRHASQAHSKRSPAEEKKENDANELMELYKDKPLEELLTIIVTTSPIKSNPSTEVLERTFATFRHGGMDFAKCPKVIICDGCRVLGDSDKQNRNLVSKKYSNAKQSLRNGIATNDQAENYQKFKIALTKICKNAEEIEDSPFHRTRVVELEERQGYGYALRHALYHEVATPFVCVIQHDRTFMRSTPMNEVVRAMVNKCNGDIKYVGINMRSNLAYRDIFISKYSRAAGADLIDMVIQPPELALDASVYGPNGSSARDIEVDDKMKRNLDSLAETYRTNIQHKSHNFDRDDGKHQLSLTPTLFWYDNTHIVETSHYRDYIFDPLYRMVAKGGFVEDRLSPLITKSVERLGLKRGHAKFKCYLLDDHSGYFFTGHLDGGSFMNQNERDKLLVLDNKTQKIISNNFV